jgi:hypothetical protein
MVALPKMSCGDIRAIFLLIQQIRKFGDFDDSYGLASSLATFAGTSTGI